MLVTDSAGRAYVSNNAGTVAIRNYQANRVEMDVRVDANADSLASEGHTVILTDLLDPDWKVQVDGKPASPVRVDGMFRGVEVSSGQHTVVWTYEPASLYWGGAISGLTLLFLATLAHFRFWHPNHRVWCLLNVDE